MDSNIRILVADDERDIHRTLIPILRYDGYNVESAYSGLQAVNIIMNQNQYKHILILDMFFPDIDGILVIDHLRKFHNNIVSIIVITGYPEAFEEEKILKMGSENVVISKYLKKPVNIEILPEVRKAIELVGNASFYQYDCFFSYSSEDAKKCQNIVNHLSQHDIRVWFDQNEIKPGNHITIGIDEGLKKSRKIVAAFSSKFFQEDSSWTLAEISSKIINDPIGKRRPLIPILLENCKIPPLYENIRHIDFRDNSDFNKNIEDLIAALKENI